MAQLHEFPRRRVPPSRHCYEITADAHEDELLQCAALPLSTLYAKIEAGETVPMQVAVDVAMMSWLLLGRALGMFDAAAIRAMAR